MRKYTEVTEGENKLLPFMIVSPANCETEVSYTVYTDLIRDGFEPILTYCKSRVCKLRAAGRMQLPSLYYAARGHIPILCMNYKITQ